MTEYATNIGADFIRGILTAQSESFAHTEKMTTAELMQELATAGDAMIEHNASLVVEAEPVFREVGWMSVLFGHGLIAELTPDGQGAIMTAIAALRAMATLPRTDEGDAAGLALLDVYSDPIAVE